MDAVWLRARAQPASRGPACSWPSWSASPAAWSCRRGRRPPLRRGPAAVPGREPHQRHRGVRQRTEPSARAARRKPPGRRAARHCRGCHRCSTRSGSRPSSSRQPTRPVGRDRAASRAGSGWTGPAMSCSAARGSWKGRRPTSAGLTKPPSTRSSPGGTACGTRSCGSESTRGRSSAQAGEDLALPPEGPAVSLRVTGIVRFPEDLLPVAERRDEMTPTSPASSISPPPFWRRYGAGRCHLRHPHRGRPPPWP